MRNMVEIIMDDEKIKRDGIYDLNDAHRIFDDLVINRKGLRKEGNFYIDDNPYDSAGVGTACFFILARKQWFRDNVKEMRWYRDIRHYGLDHDYHVEDIKRGLSDNWETERRKQGLPING